MTTIEKLSRIQGRRTKYELTARHPDGRVVLLAYCGDHSRRGLWNAITDDVRMAALVRLVGGPSIVFAKRAADGATMGAWHIGWSGRTQRDAIQSGELVFVCDTLESVGAA